MALEDIITGPEKVVLQMKAGDRWAAIDELMERLAEGGQIDTDSREAIVAAVKKREETMSTGVGHGIGIPHAATPHVSKIVGVFGISRGGIEFEALDGEPVHLIMLFVVPEAHFQAHLDTLAEIARTLTEPERREALIHASDPADVVSILHAAAEG